MKTILVDHDQIDDCDHPFRDVSTDNVARLLRYVPAKQPQDKNAMDLIRLNDQKNKKNTQKTDQFNNGKSLPVLKKTLKVDVVDERHRLAVLRTHATDLDRPRERQC